MIGQHPELAGLPELKLFGFRTIGELQASLPTYWRERGFTHRSPGLVRALAELEFGGQTPKRLLMARAWLTERAGWSGADVLDHLLARLAPRTGVEKSPETVNDGAALRRAARAYPEARYLHLTRHPTTTAASIGRHVETTLPGGPHVFDLAQGVENWREVHERILRFTGKLPRDRVMRLMAEDALADPRASMRAVARWLRLSDDAEAIEAMLHPEASPFARFGPPGSGVIGGHDHGFLRDPVPRPVEPPPIFEPKPSWSDGQRAARLAEQFGYAVAQRRSSRPRDARLAAELTKRAETDRASRLAFDGDPADMTRLMEIDADNSAWLEGMVERSGWPDRGRVGEEGANAAWLIAQHADRRPDLQRRFHAAMKEAVARGEASPANFARLTERVLLASGRDQEYGTQLVAHAGRYEAANLRAPRGVDRRRASVGPEPLALEVREMQLRRAAPRAVRCACPSCGELIAVSPPAPGRTTRYQCPQCMATGTVRSRARTSPRAPDSQTA